MAYDGKLLARARTELEKQKSANREELQRRRNEVYAALPEVNRIDAALRNHMIGLVRLTIKGGSSLNEEIGKIREENLDLQMRRAELLTAAGFGADYLDEIVTCPLCRDTGIYEGKVCRCLDRLYNAELTRELGALMHRGDESFAKFDLSLYPDLPGPKDGTIPREVMKRVFEFCLRYADSFTPEAKNLLFQGDTGLGKTYLSACIARVIAGRGFSVCYDTASSALDLYEKSKFSRDSAEGESAALRIRRMENCDLMILDDLGTEMLTSMSQSALYTLVNNRLVNRRCIIISTNLSDAELTKRYTPQIVSRLLGEFQIIPFVGEDIRRFLRE